MRWPGAAALLVVAACSASSPIRDAAPVDAALPDVIDAGTCPLEVSVPATCLCGGRLCRRGLFCHDVGGGQLLCTELLPPDAGGDR